MARIRREEWARWVARWRRSGLSAARFAAREGINARTLVWWRWKLGTERRDEQRARARPRATSDYGGAPDALAKAPVDFVELVTPVVSEPFEVEGAGHYRVRVPVRFDGAALAHLLDVLEAR